MKAGKYYRYDGLSPYYHHITRVKDYKDVPGHHSVVCTTISFGDRSVSIESNSHRDFSIHAVVEISEAEFKRAMGEAILHFQKSYGL